EMITSPHPGAKTYNQLTLPYGEPVEFRVTAADVNHGFAIYDNLGVLLAQTQAMPGYVNRLYFRFPKPGTYHILCLEYCGVGHLIMHANIEVIQTPASAAA
ncbi:MAG: hypothetical protein ACRETA_12285, partial [Gammaproteobacteria bacterium]